MPNHGHRRRPEAGFTLVEMIIVVAIIAVLSAILSLSIRQIRASFALTRAATIATAELRRAHALAVAEGVPYTVEFVLGNPAIKRYRGTDTVPERQVSGDNWPPSVEIRGEDQDQDLVQDCRASTDKCVTFTFGFLGAPEQDGDIVLWSETLSRPLALTVEPATGQVRVQ